MTMPDKMHFLCSCPDYLHGTGKQTKRKTACKHCKGIKLPFTAIGGTVRMFSTTPYILDSAVTRNCFATVRLPSTLSCEHQRPTVLCRENDPYNFLRQSRLLCTVSNDSTPQQQCSRFAKITDRTSRTFVKTSTRTPSEFYYNHSILQTPINPYELISSTLHNNEFSPGTIIFPDRNENCRYNDIPFPDGPTDVDLTKSIKMSRNSEKGDQQDGTSNLLVTEFSEDKSTSVKSSLKVSSKTSGSLQTMKSHANDVTSLTVGRSKRVQFNTLPEYSFNTLPELQRSKNNKCNYNLSEFGERNDANSPKTSTEIAKIRMNSENSLKRVSQRRKPVVRSISDRRDKDPNEALNFKDTTALRTKSKRACPQQLFQRPIRTVYSTGIARPTCPPPKLPDVRQNSDTPQRPPRQQKKSTKKSLTTKLDEANLEISKIDEAKASRIFGLLPVSTINKNKIDPVINEAHEPLKSSIQKTSITINTDACLSNVKVNDHVKIYHSSVLIKDKLDQIDDIQKEFKKSIDNKNAEEQNSLENNSEMTIVCHDKNSETSKNIDVLEIISTNMKTTKTLICLEYAKSFNSSQNDEEFSIENGSAKFMSIKRPDDQSNCDTSASSFFEDSFILKLLNDPYLSHLLYGLEMKTIANIIKNSMIRLRTGQYNFKARSTKDDEFITSLHDIIKDERSKYDVKNTLFTLNNSHMSNLNDNPQNGLLHNINIKQMYSCNKTIPVQKLYDMLVDTSIWKSGEPSTNESHQYESINCDPIYEEINENPPPLPTNPPPISNGTPNKPYKPMFLGATKHDIISYLVNAKDRIVVPEESYTFKFLRRSTNDDAMSSEKVPDNGKLSNERISNGNDKCIASIERNDSGVGSETSKTSRTKYQPGVMENKKVYLCEDCDDPIEFQMLDMADIYAPILCRACSKKRAERREILWEFIETEKKYTRDLQIIIDEFYRPMLVAGLLTQEQLSAIFLNIEELLENSEAFYSKIRDALETANEQGDDDLLTVDIGKIILENKSMFSAFETYCIQQAAASLLLANLEKDKELLRIFLRVSQMENTVLRRMNLNSFLMVPVQRVTKYPLLTARLYKVTPGHLEGREHLKEAQENIETHLCRMNREAQNISTKLWRRLSSNPLRTREYDIANIKLRKIAMDCLDWNHENVHFIVEGKLLITHPTDNNWRKGKTIKLTPVCGLLITNDLASAVTTDRPFVNFPRYSQNKEAAFLLIREKSNRYTIYREPFYLDRCVVCTESDLTEYFEVHEISSKDSFIFKAEDDSRTKHWYNQLQYHAQGTGAWRKRRTGLANIMINGMMLRQ